EERTPNVDLLIQDFIHKLRKQTKWKAQFATWRYVNKMDPIAVGKHIGAIREDGILLVGSKNWPKFEAYRKFYGNGPLVYPKSIYSHTT
ncbi:Avirulence (Avh) protein, partial [Phytophthora megakarya]